MSEWQPIETAPRDGVEILTLWPHYRGSFNPEFYKSGVPIGPKIAICRWYSVADGEVCYAGDIERDGGYWTTLSGQSYACLDEGNGPTHWMPLPSAPGTSHATGRGA